MKANSFVFTGIQKPLTVLGLPAKVFVLVVAATTVAFGAIVALGVMEVAIPVSVVTFIVLWFLMWRRSTRDHHFGNYLFALPRFWAGRSRPAHILAGSRHVDGVLR